MDSLGQPNRPRSVSGAENILRIGRGEQPAPNPALRDGELSRKGQAALDLVSQVAETVERVERELRRIDRRPRVKRR